MIRIKWLPLTGYTLPIFNADQSNGLKIVIHDRITEIRAYCPALQASSPPAESSLRGERKILSTPAMTAECGKTCNFTYLMTPCSWKRCFGRAGIADKNCASAHGYIKARQKKYNKHVLLQLTMYFSYATAAPLTLRSEDVADALR